MNLMTFSIKLDSSMQKIEIYRIFVGMLTTTA